MDEIRHEWRGLKRQIDFFSEKAQDWTISAFFDVFRAQDWAQEWMQDWRGKAQDWWNRATGNSEWWRGRLSDDSSDLESRTS
jgi:hypothetical protein